MNWGKINPLVSETTRESLAGAIRNVAADMLSEHPAAGDFSEEARVLSLALANGKWGDAVHVGLDLVDTLTKGKAKKE